MSASWGWKLLSWLKRGKGVSFHLIKREKRKEEKEEGEFLHLEESLSYVGLNSYDQGPSPSLTLAGLK